MAVVLEDLPPLMWHAELGRSMRDHWTGDHHRGVQLHDLREAVTTWQDRYGQRAWLRQVSPDVGQRAGGRPAADDRPAQRGVVPLARGPGVAVAARPRRLPHPARGRAQGTCDPEDAYCAEVVAVTLEAMGILRDDVPTNWYDPGRFWSGDSLPLRPGWTYGVEVEVDRASR